MSFGQNFILELLMPWIYRQTASSRDPEEVGKVEVPYRPQRAKVSQLESAARLSLL